MKMIFRQAHSPASSVCDRKFLRLLVLNFLLQVAKEAKVLKRAREAAVGAQVWLEPSAYHSLLIFQDDL